MSKEPEERIAVLKDVGRIGPKPFKLIKLEDTSKREEMKAALVDAMKAIDLLTINAPSDELEEAGAAAYDRAKAVLDSQDKDTPPTNQNRQKRRETR